MHRERSNEVIINLFIVELISGAEVFLKRFTEKKEVLQSDRDDQGFKVFPLLPTYYE